MATIESMALGAQPRDLTDQNSAHKRKLHDSSAAFDSADTGLIAPKKELDTDALADLDNDDVPMSETKRRAQNRAAQRAFRERKERHLRELEKRLAELESESRSWKSTNIVLRSQLSLLEEQLNHYRNPMPANAQQGPPPPGQHPNNPMANPSMSFPVPQQRSPAQDLQQIPSPANGDFGYGDYSNYESGTGMMAPSLSSTESSSNTFPDASPDTPSKAEVFCEKLSMACGMHSRPPAPPGAPKISAEVPGWQDGNSFNGGNTSNWVVQNGGWAPEYSKDLHNSGTHQQTPQGQLAQPPAPPHNVSQGQRAQNSAPHSTSQTQQQQQQQQQPSNSHGNQQPGSIDPIPPVNIHEPLNFDFGGISSGFGGYNFGGGVDDPLGLGGDNNMDNLLNNDFGVFDPLDNLLEWEPPKPDEFNQQQYDQPYDQSYGQSYGQQSYDEPYAQQQAYDPSQLGQDMPGQQHMAQARMPSPHAVSPHGPHSLQNSAPSSQANPLQQQSTNGMDPAMGTAAKHQPGAAVQSNPRGQQLPSPLQDNVTIGAGASEEEVPAASQKFIPCADVWDRICSHPRFGEIDINSMCQELRNKARCSKTGVVLDEQDVDSVLKSFK